MSDDTRRLRPDSDDSIDPQSGPGFELDLEMAQGERVSNRYVVRRFLGQGAMGVVFEAFDEELEAVVAVKMLRPILARSEDAQARFRREVTTARRVTHANVCRIYDLGHHFDSRSALDLPFFTMELLPGPTLSTWINDRGRLDLDETIELLRGIVAGLAAAHTAGVVHRDLKSSNVIILGDDESPRPVLTDFGLSRHLDSGSKSPITHQGQVLGTPAFISPEQLRSGPVTHSADIYALGVMMYQMVTGQLPYVAKNPVATAMLRLQKDPEPPTVYVPELDSRWERTILRCLQQDPADRPPNVAAVLASLDPTLSTAELKTEPDAKTNRPPTSPAGANSSRLVPTLALIGLALVSTGLLLTLRSPPASDGETTHPETSALTQQVAAVPARPTLAVATLTPLSAADEFDWIGTAVAEMLTTEAAAVPTIRPLTREDVVRAEGGEDQELPDLADRLGVDYLVRGTYLVEGSADPPTLRLDLRLFERSAPDQVRSWTESSTTDQIITLMHLLGSELRRSLGGTPLSAEQTQQLARTQPGDQEVARRLTEGREALLRNDGLAAQLALNLAVELQPDHPILNAELGRAWHKLGYDKRAQAAADRARDLGDSIPREAQLLIQAQSQEYRGQWTQAAETYDALARFYPDDETYAARRTEAWVGAGFGLQADQSLADLESRFDSSATPRTALLEAKVSALRSDIPRLYDSAHRALKIAETSGERLIEAEARLRAANGSRRLGRLDEAAGHLERASSIYRNAGDALGLARVLVEEARLASSQGDAEGAERLLLEARTTYVAIGNQRGRIDSTLTLASLERRRGHSASARRYYEEARALAEEVGFTEGRYDASKGLAILNSIEGDLATAEDHFRVALEAAENSGNLGDHAAALNNLAIVLSDRGDTHQAEQYYQKALVLFEEIGHLDGVGSALNNLAILQWDRGDLDGATESYSRCIATYESLADRSSLALARANLAEVERDQGDFAAAVEGLSFAVDLQEQLGEPLAAAKNRALLAQVRLDTGETAIALDLARQAVSTLAEREIPDDEAMGRTVLARALASRGSTGAASREIELALRLADQRENPAIALWIEIEAIAIEVLYSEPSEEALEAASAELTRLVDRARAEGIVRLQLEARFLLGRIGVLLGENDTTDLEALAGEAQSLGYGRFSVPSSQSR